LFRDLEELNAKNVERMNDPARMNGQGAYTHLQARLLSLQRLYYHVRIHFSSLHAKKKEVHDT